MNDTEQDLEASLVPRTYLVANYFTAADVALYGALHPILVCLPRYVHSISPLIRVEQSQLQPAQYYSHPAVTRYFDHVQSRSSVRKAAESLAPAFSVVPFNLENAPAQERKADPPKEKKSKASTPVPDGDKVAAKAEKADKAAAKTDKAAKKGEEGKKAAESGEKEGKAQKKEKKAKEPKEPKTAEKKPAAEDAGPPVPSMIDLRVGHIVDSKCSCDPWRGPC